MQPPKALTSKLVSSTRTPSSARRASEGKPSVAQRAKEGPQRDGLAKYARETMKKFI